MATVEAHGIRARLPEGFDAHIFRRSTIGDERSYAVAHFATFPIPADTGDFGGGAVTLMRPSDIFAVLFEYGPESLGKKLFAERGMPRALQASDFRPTVLRRGLQGQAGTQWFFTESGRPFTFYAVLGAYSRRAVLVPKVNSLLSSLTVASAAATAGGGSTASPWN
ncbi:MAG TPA: hypothetical protein VEI83_13140 [Acidimicrobiales bacterium]|nr:hypothetical protein [Acidimicrobiales bacterium]